MDTLKLPEDQPIESKLISGVIESAQAKIEGMNFDLRKHVLEYDEVMNKHRETIYRKRKEILEASPEELKNKTLEMARKTDYKDEDYTKKEEELGSDNMRKLERIVALRTLDMLWMNHLEDMEALRDSVRLRAYGQRDPLVEYKSEGHKVFQQLLQTLETTIVQNIMKASIAPRQAPPAAARQPQPRATEKHVGRNDPCPCGAKHPDGRPIKFKHCHGKT